MLDRTKQAQQALFFKENHPLKYSLEIFVLDTRQLSIYKLNWDIIAVDSKARPPPLVYDWFHRQLVTVACMLRQINTFWPTQLFQTSTSSFLIALHYSVYNLSEVLVQLECDREGYSSILISIIISLQKNNINLKTNFTTVHFLTSLIQIECLLYLFVLTPLTAF